MERIQLYLSKSLRGFKTLVSINGTEYGAALIRDLRPALDVVEYDSTEKCVFYLIQYVEGATLVSVLRTIPDKPGDHLAATLVLPEGIQVPAADLDALLRRITRKVSNPGMSQEDIAELQSLFQAEYPVDPEPPVQQPSRGRIFACRHYGGDTGVALIDFLGDMLYQVTGANYAGVLLVDADLPFALSGPNLTDEPLAAPVKLIPPAPVAGYELFVYGRPFTRPILVAPHTPLNIVWKREGTEPIVQPVFVGSTDCTPQSPIMPTPPATKKVTPNSFYITSRYSNQRLKTCIIEVNGQTINGEVEMPLDDLRQAAVHISCPGYISYSAELDLSATNQALVELVERATEPVDSDTPGDTKREVAESIATHDHRRREQRRKRALWKNIITLGIGVAIATLLALWFLPDLTGNVFGGDENQNPNSIAGMRMQAGDSVNQPASNQTAEPQVDQAAANEQSAAAAVQATAPAAQPTAPAVQPPGGDAAAATKYLDDSSAWTKAEMQSNALLKAYYNDLIAFNFDALIKKWPQQLPNSSQVKEVAKHAQEAQRKKLDPKAKGNRYNEKTDKIYRREYVNWINRSQK